MNNCIRDGALQFRIKIDRITSDRISMICSFKFIEYDLNNQFSMLKWSGNNPSSRRSRRAFQSINAFVPRAHIESDQINILNAIFAMNLIFY